MRCGCPESRCQRALDLNRDVLDLPEIFSKNLDAKEVRNPVVNISVRVWIGIQKMLAIPGVLMLAFISAMSLSQVMPARHWLEGFSMHDCLKHGERRGIGWLSACPALPNTVSTSGSFRIMRSWICRILVASVTDMPGTAVGI